MHIRTRNIRSLWIAVFLCVCTVGIWYQFAHIPSHVSFDEIEFAKLAHSLSTLPYSPYSEMATGHSTLYFYMINFSMQLFGISVFALRLPSAIFGSLCIVMYYLVLKSTLKPKQNALWLILLTVILFAGSRWFYNFARFSFEATFLLFLELISLWAMMSYTTDNRRRWLIFSGIAAGLAYNSYTPGRIFVILLFLILLYEHVTRPAYHPLLWRHIWFFIVPFIIVIAPLTIYLTLYPDLRYDKLAFFTDEHLSVYTKTIFSLDNLKRFVLMYVNAGDINGRHNYPGKAAVNPITAILFTIGLIRAIKNIKHLPNLIFVSYLLISYIPAFLTYPWENPNMLRMYTALPAVIYCAGYAVALFLEKSKNHVVRVAFISVISIVIFLGITYEARTYFVYQKTIFNTAFEFPASTLEKELKK